jgi:replicative DNA helicase
MSVILDNLDKDKQLGVEYQEQFINEIIIDKRFADDIIPLVKPEHFNNENLRSLVSIIINFHLKYNQTPSYVELESEVKRVVNNTLNCDVQLDLISKLKNTKTTSKYVQDISSDFLYQQNMIEAILKINKIASKFDSSSYPKMQEILSKALLQNNRQDIGTYLFDGLECVYEPDYRKPMPLGLPGLDYVLNGGLARGELMIVIAPLGTGKTTMSTYVANKLMLNNNKVIQMFFEDTEQQIRQKHAACLHKIKIQDLPNHKDKCIELDKDYKELFGSNLILKKFHSGKTYVSTIRNYLNKVKSIGFMPDFIVLDYLDKITPEKNERFASKYEAQDEIVNQVEALCDEFNIACLTMIQSNRNGINNENVQVKDSGGSISRAQIGHIVATLSKSTEQASANIATLKIEKSRVGTAPWVFEDIRYNNSMVNIEIPLELGKENLNGLGLTLKKEHGITTDEFLKEAKKSIAKKNNFNLATNISEEDKTPSEIEIEIKKNSIDYVETPIINVDITKTDDIGNKILKINHSDFELGDLEKQFLNTNE